MKQQSCKLIINVSCNNKDACRNLATKQQEELYRNQYERKINELQDLFNSYNTPVIEEKLKEMDNIPDIPF
ncbi:MAG: hypothetical protein IIT58_01510 [Treponema sp.]|nr:hypothetical protein [Treponema sp.]